MDFEETEVYTPRGSKKTTVRKAATSVKNLFTKRHTKSVSSERTLGSERSLDQSESPSSKKFSLIGRHRRSKTRDKGLPERGAVTDRGAQRRSFSFDDMKKLGDETPKPKIQPLEAGVKAPDTEGLKKEALDNVEGRVTRQGEMNGEDVKCIGLVLPETPVLEARPVGERTSSSANNALTEIEAKVWLGE